MGIRWWREAVLWAGCSLCVLIVAAFVVSGWWTAGTAIGTRSIFVVVGSGSVVLFLNANVVNSPYITLDDGGLQAWNTWRIVRHFGSIQLWVPLYAPFLALGVPTFLVWPLVPQFPRGHCPPCAAGSGGTSRPAGGYGTMASPEGRSSVCHSR